MGFILDRLVKVFTSLRLTVVLLAFGLILVFWGTLAQVHLGLYRAQNEFFRSWLVYWQPAGSGFKLPIFPGGYLIGGLLLINLTAAHTRYYKTGWRKIGIVMIHAGLVLLLLGQFATDFLAQESTLHLRNGETRNYTEADRSYELAIVDVTDAAAHKVVAIPLRALQAGPVSVPQLPFTVRAKALYPNSDVQDKSGEGFAAVPAGGVGAGLWWRERPRETAMDRRDMPSVIVELNSPQGADGHHFASAYLGRPDQFTAGGRRYELSLRLERFYLPYSLHLVEFRHDLYPGTQIPKNFSSRVRLQRPATGEDREVLIYMNSPLRYGGQTFYQASFDPDDQGTVLQVVRNPGWLTPYFACLLVGAGLVTQFLLHLVPFLKRRMS
ncbi:MAG: cytochrome c biogenesis protein ResB [Verrucomicrobiota bacterium]